VSDASIMPFLYTRPRVEEEVTIGEVVWLIGFIVDLVMASNS